MTDRITDKNTGTTSVTYQENLRSTQYIPIQIIDRFNDSIAGIIKTIQDWVRIPTEVYESLGRKGSPCGALVKRALKLAIHDAHNLGFKTHLGRSGFYGIADSRPITEEDKVILIPLHLDVVPTGDHNLWIENDPYKGAIIGSKLYGRGTQDNKGPAATVMYSAATLLDLPQTHPIRLVFFTDEERGTEKDVEEYIKDHPNVKYEAVLVPDTQFFGVMELPIIRAGISGEGKPLPSHKVGDIEIISISTGDNRANQVPSEARVMFEAQDKGLLEGLRERMGKKLTEPAEFGRITKRGKRYEMSVKVIGKAAHASTAWEGLNAVQELAWALRGEGFKDTPPARAIYYLIQKKGAIGYDSEGKSFGFASKDHKTTGRQAFNVGVFNINNNNERDIVIDTRVRFDLEPQYVKNALSNFATGAGYALGIQMEKKGIKPDTSSDVIRIAGEIYQHLTGRAPVLDKIGGGTFARSFMYFCKNTLGLGFLPPWHNDRMHKVNEYITIPKYIEFSGFIYLNILYQLSVDHGEVAKLRIENLLGGSGKLKNVDGIIDPAAVKSSSALTVKLDEVEKAVKKAREAVETVEDKVKSRVGKI